MTDSTTGLFGSFDSDLSANSWRNVFTTIFLVLNFLIAWIGHRLVKRQCHRTLLKSKPVPVTRFTPWLSLGSTFSYIWTLRRIPGGWLGIIMIFSGIFGTGNRYIINSCIFEEKIMSRCPFKNGLVTMQYDVASKPVNTWAITFLAINAVEVARARGAEVGVYSKVNNNVTSFFPRKEDVIGNWDCAVAGPNTVIQPKDWADATLDDFIQNQTFFAGMKYWSGSSTPSRQVSRAFMAWGPHADTASNKTNIRAMISNPPVNDTKGVVIIAPASITNLECNLAIVEPKWKPAPWPIDTFEDWAGLMTGFILEVGASRFPAQLTKVLNAMSMISGSGNIHNFERDDAEKSGAGTDFGCMVPNTRIEGSVYVVAFALTGLVALMLIIDLYDVIQNKIDKRHKAIEKMPFEMLDWQVALIEKINGHEIDEPRKLAGYEYFWDEQTGRSHCRRSDQRGSVYEALENPENTASDPSFGKDGIVVKIMEK
ncbi:uncharacterized protein RSE6_10412 [Rhynchosporium secalis]|uniref:Uncharacterized protein n=1 Tax=Rhynchosporium secalis TaxID=38038 RepID=A0A1E1MKE7_RHYSE|nr:uncharacterized protein RSE6_10412 [Rhynchosporium secalis]